MSETHFNHSDTQFLKNMIFFFYFLIFSGGGSHNPDKNTKLGPKIIWISAYLILERPPRGFSEVLSLGGEGPGKESLNGIYLSFSEI